jgi:hypothetical protein
MAQRANTHAPNDLCLSLLFWTVQFVEWDRLFESLKRQAVGIGPGADLGTTGDRQILLPVEISIQSIFITTLVFRAFLALPIFVGSTLASAGLFIPASTKLPAYRPKTPYKPF